MAVLRVLTRFWLILLLVAAGGLLAFYNQQAVVVTVPHFGHYKTPLGVALIGAFAFGASVVVLFFFLDFFKKSIEIRSLSKRVRQLQEREPEINRPLTNAES